MSALPIAVLGWVVGGLAVLVLEMMGNHAISTVLDRARSFGLRRRTSRRRDVQRSGTLERTLVDFYEKTPLRVGMVQVAEGRDTRLLPVYSPDAWRVTAEIAAGRPCVNLREVDLFISTNPPRDRSTASEKPRSIRRRERLVGGELWDGDALVTSNTPVRYGSSVAVTGTGYFDIGGRMVELEEEAVRHAQHRWRRLSEHRRGVGRFASEPRGIGGVALLCVERHGQVELLIHRRSEDVATAPGAWCATPTFIMEDPQSSGRQSSSVGLGLYNVLRETLEEAYGFPDLRLPSTRLDTDWFLDVGLGQELKAGIDDGTVQALHLGWCVNLLSGQLDMLTLLLVAGDETLVEQVHRSVDTASDEVAGQTARWILLDAEELSDMLLQPTFHGGSAVAVYEARALLSAIRDLHP